MRSSWTRPAVLIAAMVSACAVTVAVIRHRDGAIRADMERVEQSVAGLRSTQRRMEEQLRRAGLGLSRFIDVHGAPSVGQESAPVTLVEFGDYECSFCAKSMRTVAEVERRYVQAGTVRIAFLAFPVPRPGATSFQAHVFAHCASQQQKFWEVHPLLFARSGETTQRSLDAVARSAALDANQLQSCMTAPVSRQAIEDEVARGRVASVGSTPYYFLGFSPAPGTSRVEILETIKGAAPFESFEQAVDRLLSRARLGAIDGPDRTR